MINNLINLVSANFLTCFELTTILVLSLYLVFKTKRSYLIILAILIWYPLENFLFNYIPSEYFVFFKYFPEVLLYLTGAISWVLYVKRTGRLFPYTPLNKVFLLFLGAAFLGWIFNRYSFGIWFLGLRQILRYSVVFWIIILEDYEDRIVKMLLYFVLGVMGFEALLGLIQYLSGGVLDKYLFFSRSFGVASSYLGDLEQFWEPGTRVFATLGRYDQLGSFLFLGLVLLLSIFYGLNNSEFFKNKKVLAVSGVIGVLVLALTYSRASYLAFLVALLAISWFLKKDKRIIKFLLVGFALGAAYLGIFAMTYDYNVLNIVDKPRETLAERFFEIFSPRSLVDGYYGYGRVFFLINTPLVVVKSSPIWGVGLGNYGDGVAASLNNTTVYDRLGLPFGIQNFYGQIDNNWFALWGEVGTFGVLAWAWIFYTVFKIAWDKSKKENKDFWGGVLSRAMVGITLGIAVLGFFGPYFEFRSLMFYFWLLTGLLFLYWRLDKNSNNFLKV